VSERSTVVTSTAIVGAGIAGMSAARMLVEHGHDVTVFEKSRGAGGRAARRRRDGFEFDHGAQYFTARSRVFRDHVNAWQQEGVVEEWSGKVVSLGTNEKRSPTVRYVGVPGMSSVARSMGRGVKMYCGHRVDSVVRGTAGWTLHFEGGNAAGPFENLLLTMPAPQASALLSTACTPLAERCDAVRMSPCWATMLVFQTRLDVDFDAAFVETPGPLRWLARNSSKPRRPAGETWVIHARPDWTLENLERSPEAIVECMTKALDDVVETRVQPLLSIAHRWRHALVERPLGESCLYDDERRIGAAGDWCLGPRIECAFHSGMSAAARIVGARYEP
jgi:predicted NAD/FAD-dependent oxidoreductase